MVCVLQGDSASLPTRPWPGRAGLPLPPLDPPTHAAYVVSRVPRFLHSYLSHTTRRMVLKAHSYTRLLLKCLGPFVQANGLLPARCARTRSPDSALRCLHIARLTSHAVAISSPSLCPSCLECAFSFLPFLKLPQGPHLTPTAPITLSAAEPVLPACSLP